MRAAIYSVWFDNSRQDPVLNTLQRVRLRKVREHVAQRGWELADEYIDRVPGTVARPQFDRLVADATVKKCDAIVSFRLSYFGTTANLRRLSEIIRFQGIDFIAVADGIDTTIPAIARRFLASLAKFTKENRQCELRSMHASQR